MRHPKGSVEDWREKERVYAVRKTNVIQMSAAEIFSFRTDFLYGVEGRFLMTETKLGTAGDSLAQTNRLEGRQRRWERRRGTVALTIQ